MGKHEGILSECNIPWRNLLIDMIFVTVGSQKFQFNRLLKEIDKLIEKGIITEGVFAQVGASDYAPQHYADKAFLDKEEFADWQDKCDIVITHGGTGAIIGAIKKGKKVIAVPRLEKYGEHVDDHQLQLLRQFEGMGIIDVCYDINRLGESYKSISDAHFQTYESNTQRFIDSIEEFIHIYIENKVKEGRHESS